MEDADTICAVSTPPGEGGIGIIRISGGKAHEIVTSLFKPKKKRLKRYSPGKLYLGDIVGTDNPRQIDEVMVTLMTAPKTYTREDIAEIHCHGSFAVQSAILSALLDAGARLAEPGEFTKRAFLNGRLDLLQAESVLDIIRSETGEELRCAISCLKGDLSRKIASFQDHIRQALVAVEASIDFPEEDLLIDLTPNLRSLKRVHGEIEGLLASYYEGKGLKQGYEVLITGRANVGKSSLLNALLMEERAIVTHLPGTTRDLIEETVYLEGVKVRLVDTAGIGTARDAVEEEGIRRVLEKVSEADLSIWLLDGSQHYTDDDESVYNNISLYNHIVVINKIDKEQTLDTNILINKNINEWIEISAKERLGLDGLKYELYSKLTKKKQNHPILITSTRHRDILAKVADNVWAVIEGSGQGMHSELMAFELHEALHRIGQITGEDCSEKILDDIFSQFCIGK